MSRPQARPANAAVQSARGRAIWSKLAILVFLLPAAAVLLPTTVVLGVLLLPTIAALLVDRIPGRALAVAVGLLNGAGCIPAVVNLWSSGHSLLAAQYVLADTLMWLWAYTAAGAGWLIFLALPPLLRQYYAFATQARLHALQRRQEQLRKDWGQAVTGLDSGAEADSPLAAAEADDAARKGDSGQREDAATASTG